MRRLGLVLAGGRSSRFGSDKAEAMLDGQTLLARAVDAVAARCDAVAVVGRQYPGTMSLRDWPRPDMGPLGGLAAGLMYGAEQGFDDVLSIPVDAGRLPDDRVTALAPAPAHIASQPVIGLWPVSALAVLQDILRHDGKHSMLRFCAAIESRAVHGFTPDNINTPDDLARASLFLKGKNEPC